MKEPSARKEPSAHQGAANSFRISANIDSRRRLVAAESGTIPSKPADEHE